MSTESENKIESEIKERNLTALRLTPEMIDNVIAGETFTVLPSGKVMICELTLKNGFTVRGEAATVSKENFNIAMGEKISRENARRKVWELEGYLLQETLYPRGWENYAIHKIIGRASLSNIRGRSASFA